jgi:hypothetical protein
MGPITINTLSGAKPIGVADAVNPLPEDVDRALAAIKHAVLAEEEATRQTKLATLKAFEVLAERLFGCGSQPGAPEGSRIRGPLVDAKTLSRHIGYAPKTLRNLKHQSVLIEGVHYVKKRGKLLFSLPAMLEWAQNPGAAKPKSEPIPFARRRRRARTR